MHRDKQVQPKKRADLEEFAAAMIGVVWMGERTMLFLKISKPKCFLSFHSIPEQNIFDYGFHVMAKYSYQWILN